MAVAVVDAVAERAELVAAELTALGAQAKSFTLDVRDPLACEATIAATEAALGPIDAMVGAAGISSPAAAHSMSDELWTRCLDVNLRHVPLDTADRPTDAVARSRRHCRDCIRRRTGRSCGPRSLQCFQARGDRAHASAGHRVGASWGACQRHRARRRRHATGARQSAARSHRAHDDRPGTDRPAGIGSRAGRTNHVFALGCS